MMGYWGYQPYYNNFGFGGILMIVWWVLVAWLIFALLRFLFGGHRRWRDQMPENDSDEALKILKQRYARGDISKKEFDAMKKDIA
jgi:putative membrane protein